eukprot:CAMPEP_0173378306 /NCGR_PEP_ID=MMETSP1356-20130122/1484_1 /TAXON_ID=77927 ORGANISM="Hemiselmis virescens, Strain PCC157" /NCGR_SAMPLE_ID=MMETSP1356 /ASSEMBLY_ACC=CAM_ASM_000847 /LENGTH=231 /DNA_ID=CAMNT_0014331333 /DNA_START=13 /DNA_END=708 /DNA_ORIENTATION=-
MVMMRLSVFLAAFAGAAHAFSAAPGLGLRAAPRPAGCSAAAAGAIGHFSPLSLATPGSSQQRSGARTASVLRMSTTEKQSPLEAGGARGIDEEERRVGMWRQRFELSDEQIEALRNSFEKLLKESSGDLRTVNKDTMKCLIEGVNIELDMVNVVKAGDRPVVSEDELNNYVNALKDLWEEACNEDAVEVANGECYVPLDTKNFDLSEVVAVYGMCVRDHCGIGGVCFWDSD